ncbi:hypothetical protein [Spirosoma flavum]|uniref:Lipoprotein n=1 Tax=Spirosoma flavum TaxID=2048557 RepID=A0ABW6AES8_9BACT
MSFHFCRLLLVLFAVRILSGCRSAEDEPLIADYAYFPLETGRYVIYDVQENKYTLNAGPVQRTYQLKEVIGSTYADVTGQTAYRLIRYRRSTTSQPWQADSVWSARLVNNEAIRTENGQDFVSLLFPISNELSWNGNRHNAFDQNDYQARNVGQPYRVLDKQFNETVTVAAQDDSTLVLQDKHIDVYARQIGLIHRERTYLQFCTATPSCIGKNQIDYGIRQVYNIQTYGKE